MGAERPLQEISNDRKRGIKNPQTGEAKEWLSAKAKGLDMRPEAVHKRAEEMFPKIMYKGTTSIFNEFSIDKENTDAATSMVKGATFVSSDPHVAEWFAMFPLRSPELYIRTLMRKTGIWKPGRVDDARQIELFLEAHPNIKETYKAFKKILDKHNISKETLLGRWLKEKKLRNKVLEAAERIAESFQKETGVPVEIRPTIMPLRVDDSGFIEVSGNNMPMEHPFNWETMQFAEGDARRKGRAGIAMYDVRDGADISSTVMAIYDMARIRSTSAAFDPTLKEKPGLLH